jgi:hypothetical protein
VKIALLATASSLAPGSASRVGALLPHLREGAEIELFVAAGTERAERGTRSARELDPQGFDQILYAIGNERAAAFAKPVLRAFGGTVAIDGWSLRELAYASRPELEQGGVRGIWAAWVEGGVREARSYAAGARSELALNRSIVRHADAFLVPEPELARRIRIDRNAPTPVGVVAMETEDPASAARRWLEHLASFPTPRVRRKSLIRSMIEASDRARQERASETSRGG